MDDIITISLRAISIVTIATAKELTDIDLLGIVGFLLFAFNGFCLSRDTHKGIPGAVNLIRCLLIQLFRHCRIRSTDGTGDIITTIYLINKDIVRGMFTVNIDKGIAFHISHTGATIDSIDITSMHSDFRTSLRRTSITTTIHVTANGNLGLHRKCKQTKQYYGYDLLHYSLTFITGLSSSSSES